MATLLDRLLDRVSPGHHELTIDTEGYSGEQVDRILKTARGRGLHAACGGRFILVRDLRGELLGQLSQTLQGHQTSQEEGP